MAERRRALWLIGVAAFCGGWFLHGCPRARAAPPPRYACLDRERGRARAQRWTSPQRAGTRLDAAVMAALVTARHQPDLERSRRWRASRPVYLAKDKKTELLDFSRDRPRWRRHRGLRGFTRGASGSARGRARRVGRSLRSASEARQVALGRARRARRVSGSPRVRGRSAPRARPSPKRVMKRSSATQA